MADFDPLFAKNFQIESEVDLDFVIGQKRGWPVGMQRKSPPEFRRRILAAKISYESQLSSIDYTLKRYVDPDRYENLDSSLGDEVSDYLHASSKILSQELRKLHTDGASFGVFGAEITLYRIPHALDVARMLANRGLLLEVLPVLRLCLEMASWAGVAFKIGDNEDRVVALKAQSCISDLKQFYETAGKLYGYLSQFTHWGHVIHGDFLNFDEPQVGVVYASVLYRAMTLALCIVILDVMTVATNQIYGERSSSLVLAIQGSLERSETIKTYQYLSKISALSDLNELWEIQSFHSVAVRDTKP